MSSRYYFFKRILDNETRGMRNLNDVTIDSGIVNEIEEYGIKDANCYYSKGLQSLIEGFQGLKVNSYSWSIVKLYYSTFYLSKAALIINGIYQYRNENLDLYYFNTSNSRFKKYPGETRAGSRTKTDHASCFELLKYFIPNDYLLSNNIDDEMTYAWLRRKREEINYKQKDFNEPGHNILVKHIHEILINYDFMHAVYSFNQNYDTWPFVEDYALLAIPLSRLKETNLEYHRANKRPSLYAKRRDFLLSMNSSVDNLISLGI